MGMSVTEILHESEKLKKELESIDKAIKNADVSSAVNSAEKIRADIKNYLGGISAVLIKVVKLSGGLLLIKDGRIVYKDKIPPFAFSAENAVQVADEQKQRINYVLKYMSENGISSRYLAELGKSLETLYSVYESAGDIAKADKAAADGKAKAEKAALEQKRKAVSAQMEKLDEELGALERDFENKRAAFAPENLACPKKYPEKLWIPFAVNSEMRVTKFWNPDDGLLFIKAAGDYAQTLPLIKALAIRFVYSEPNADVNLLYCARELNDDINAYLFKFNASLFFDGIKYLRSENGLTSGERDFGKTAGRLTGVCVERMNLINNAGVQTITEYNFKNPDNAQKPIFVFLQDYPHGFESCGDLKYLFSSGKKYGVYFVVIQTKDDLKKNAYSDETVAAPKDYAAISAEMIGGIPVIDGVKFESVSVSEADVNTLLAPISAAKKASNKIISYEDVGFGLLTEESNSVKETISVPVGKCDNKTYSIEFAVSGNENKPIAYLLVGAPSSGKSSLIDSMIFNGCMKYSPDDLNFYLIDFKDGVSSAMYINKAKMPHIKVVAQRSRQEDAEIILHTILKEQERRNEIFKNNQVNNLTRYNELYDKHIPRIIVVIDEASVMFDDNGENSGSVEQLVRMCRTIARQGRSAGIHLVLASQAVERKMKDITDFVNGRFCFNASPAAAENTLSVQNAKRVPVECKDPGVALASEDAGETVRRVKFAYNNGKEAEYAQAVRNKWSAYPVNTAVVGDDSQLFFDEAAKSSALYPESISGAAIGENYYNRSVEYLPFNDYNHTFLLMGQDENIQTDHLTSVMIYALKQKARVMLLDESESQDLDKTFGFYDGVKSFIAKDYLKMLSEAHAEYKKRMENRRENFEPYFVIIHSLHMISDFEKNSKFVQKQDDAFADDSGYMSLRSIREATTSGSEEVFGTDTFMEMLSHAGRAKNFYICFSADKADSFSVRHYDALSQCDFKILHYPFVPDMAKIAGRAYNDKLGNSCSKTISLLSVRQQTMEKIRYYHYEDNAATKNYIKKEITE